MTAMLNDLRSCQCQMASHQFGCDNTHARAHITTKRAHCTTCTCIEINEKNTPIAHTFRCNVILNGRFELQYFIFRLKWRLQKYQIEWKFEEKKQCKFPVGAPTWDIWLDEFSSSSSLLNVKMTCSSCFALARLLAGVEFGALRGRATLQMQRKLFSWKLSLLRK